jgi:hypothetical protein
MPLSSFFTEEDCDIRLPGGVKAMSPERANKKIEKLIDALEWYSKHSWICTEQEHSGVYPEDGTMFHDKGDRARAAFSQLEYT